MSSDPNGMSSEPDGTDGDATRSDPPPAPDVPEGLEGYPYANVAAEARIKRVATALSVVAVGMLLVGLYLALFTTSIALGGVLALIGFIDLMAVPFLAKRMRAAAIRRDGHGL